jgi:hypothetical protein
MGFLSFSNKKKLREKICHFFRVFPFEVVKWAIGDTTLIFFVQKAVAHLATSPCKTKFKLEFFVWYLT